MLVTAVIFLFLNNTSSTSAMQESMSNNIGTTLGIIIGKRYFTFLHYNNLNVTTLTLILFNSNLFYSKVSILNNLICVNACIYTMYNRGGRAHNVFRI